MQVKDALGRFVRQLEANGRSPHTTAQITRHVMMFDAWWGNDVEAVAHEDVARFLISPVVRQRADGKPRKTTSTNAIRASLRAFFGYTHAAGFTALNAGRLVRRSNVPAPRPKALSDGDVERLTNELAKATSDEERRDQVLFTLLLRVGLRLGSAVALDVEDLDLERGVLRLRSIKGGGESSAILPNDLLAMLRDHVGARTAGPLFRASHGGRVGCRHVRRRLAECAERAGIEGGVHPHELRHTLGTRVYRKTGDLLITGRVLGHRAVGSTQIYASASDDAVRRALA